jgi:hypothetical protein
MGSWDRIIRLFITLLIVVLLFTGVLTGALAIVLGIIAIICFVTSVIGFCPLYVIFGISTKKK